jgi:RNA polymerase sigma factor (TIGR02999 family)
VGLSDPRAVVTLLEACGRGDANARHEVLPLIHDELRMVAARALRREKSGPPIPVTVLVKEAYVRLLGDINLAPTSRGQFMTIAAETLREIAIERATAAATVAATAAAKAAAKGAPPADTGTADLLSIDRALHHLEQVDARQSKVVELRFFGGLSIDEVALALSVSPEAITRDWIVAKAWLYRELAIPK